MKTIFTLLICIFSMMLNAQNANKLDTIYANDTKTVSLFFPKPIRQGIVGKSHFVFSYNKEQAQYFGLLQGTPGVESNLLAITNDGQVYSFILKFVEKLAKLNYFISEQESIGNEKLTSDIFNSEKKVLAKTATVNPYPSNLYEKTCKELMVSSKKKVKYSKRRNRIKLSVKDIVFRDNSLYFLLKIENKSVIDYDVNFLRFFVSNKSSTRKKSSQSLLKKPVYTYLLPDKIKENSKSQFVLVFSKFTIPNHKKMILELNEMFGERNLKLKIPGRLIDN